MENDGFGFFEHSLSSRSRPMEKQYCPQRIRLKWAFAPITQNK